MVAHDDRVTSCNPRPGAANQKYSNSARNNFTHHCDGAADQLRGGAVSAEGDLDFRGTLGVSKEAPVGFKDIRLKFKLYMDASLEQLLTL